MLCIEHSMRFEKILSYSLDLYETRTDTRISRCYSTKETGCTNMAARFPERNIEPLQLRSIGRSVM